MTKAINTRFQPAPDSDPVSGILMIPPGARALLVFAHGAGAGMRHPFMETVSGKLAGNRIGTFRFQFPYMERKLGRPDARPVLLATVASAVNAAREHAQEIPVFAGGKSMGGRMTSNAAAEGLLPDIRGIVFFGFPLHPPGQPDKWRDRSEHLKRVEVPMLFLQGTRDSFADLKLLRHFCKGLDTLATLHLVDGGDHSFRVPKRSGRTQEDVFDDLVGTVAAWFGSKGT